MQSNFVIQILGFDPVRVIDEPANRLGLRMPWNKATTALCLLVVLLWNCGIASAASIIGTIGFNIEGNAVGSPTSITPGITFNNVRTNSSGTQDWSSFTSSFYPGGLLATNSLTVNVFDSSGSTMSFSDVGFGSFSGTVVADTISNFATPLLTLSTRWLTVSGTFTPGATLIGQGYTNQVSATLSIFYSGYTSGPLSSGARSGSVVMSTVPEPGTMAILAIGSASLIGLVRRRKSRR